MDIQIYSKKIKVKNKERKIYSIASVLGNDIPRASDKPPGT